MADSPLLTFLLCAISAYLISLWIQDFRHRDNPKTQNPFPGAWPCGTIAIAIACTGALGILALETLGEYVLGVSANQSDVSWFQLPYMLAAGFIEEIVFRGYLVYEKRGERIRDLGMILCSFLFAALHYQYYYLPIGEGGDMGLVFNAKTIWTLSLLVLNSLFFYAMRFSRWNPKGSLIPCFVAHVSSNLGVFLIKLCQGHVLG